MYRLSRVIPLSRAAVFAYDPTSDGIVCQSTHGPGIGAMRGQHRRLGDGLSGWVAANRRPIINSVPALDFADVCPEVCAEVASTLSVPLALGDSLVGVVTIYATSEQAFNDHHRQILEGIAPHIAGLLRRARVFSAATESSVPNYPGARHLDHYVRQRLQDRHPTPFALIVLQLDFVFAEQGDTALLEAVAAFASANLRGGDLVFVCGNTTLVCLLADGNESAAAAVQERLLTFHNSGKSAQDRHELCSFRSAIVSAPRDGRTLARLLSSAEAIFANIAPSAEVADRAERLG